MSERPTLRQRLTKLRLSEDDDLDAVFPPAFGRLELVVDVLELDGLVLLLGRSLDIRARQVVVTGDGPAIIDVSGPAAEPSFAPDGSDAAPNGTAASPHGRPGAAGGQGNDAGDVTIVAGEIVGQLAIRAEGSDGGNGQRGGNGVRPTRPDGANASWVDRNKREKGSRFGGGKLQGPFWWVAVAYGQPGHRARPGGNAGASGAGGDGGDGGRIVVSIAGSTSMVGAAANGGSAGLTAVDAQPGAPSAPGRGGRNRLYYQQYTIIGAKTSERGDNWVGTSTGQFPYYKRRYKLANANRNSTTKAGPGSVPARPADARAGTGQTPDVSTLASSQLADEFGVDPLELALARAHQVEVDDPETALQRYQWVLDLTARATSGPRKVLHDRAEASVSCPWPRT